MLLNCGSFDMINLGLSIALDDCFGVQYLSLFIKIKFLDLSMKFLYFT